MKLEFDIPQRNKYLTLTMTIAVVASNYEVTILAGTTSGDPYSTALTLRTRRDNPATLATVKAIASDLLEADYSAALPRAAGFLQALLNRTVIKSFAVKEVCGRKSLMIEGFTAPFELTTDSDDIEIY